MAWIKWWILILLLNSFTFLFINEILMIKFDLLSWRFEENFFLYTIHLIWRKELIAFCILQFSWKLVLLTMLTHRGQAPVSMLWCFCAVGFLSLGGLFRKLLLKLIRQQTTEIFEYYHKKSCTVFWQTFWIVKPCINLSDCYLWPS